MSNLVLVNETGLSEIQMGLAKELINKHPAIAELAEKVIGQEKELKTYYVKLCDELRKSGMNGKELTLLLLAKGHVKSRVSEIKKICSLPQEVFDKYVAGNIGRNMAVKIARTGVQNVEEAVVVGHQDEAGSANSQTPVSGSVVNLLPEKELGAIKTALKKTQISIGKHVGQVTIGGRDYNISIVVKKTVAQ